MRSAGSGGEHSIYSTVNIFLYERASVFAACCKSYSLTFPPCLVFLVLHSRSFLSLCFSSPAISPSHFSSSLHVCSPALSRFRLNNHPLISHSYCVRLHADHMQRYQASSADSTRARGMLHDLTPPYRLLVREFVLQLYAPHLEITSTT